MDAGHSLMDVLALRLEIFRRILEGERPYQLDIHYNLRKGYASAVMTSMVYRVLGEDNTPRHPSVVSPYTKGCFCKIDVAHGVNGVRHKARFSASFVRLPAVRRHKQFWFEQIDRILKEEVPDDRSNQEALPSQ